MRLVAASPGFGFRVVSNNNKTIRLDLGECTVVGRTPKGYVVLQVHGPGRQQDLGRVEADMRRLLHIKQGAWDGFHNTLVVRCARGCAIELGGEAVGRPSDLVAGRVGGFTVDLTGAWEGGYVWSAVRVVLVPGQ